VAARSRSEKSTPIDKISITTVERLMRHLSRLWLIPMRKGQSRQAHELPFPKKIV
jgi:hypothetical protein